MPAKKTKLTDAERLRRIKEAAKEAEADQSPEALDKALAKVIRPKKAAK
jgi:hypothetical protein